MPLELIVTLVAVFVSTALVIGLLVSMVLSRTAPEVRRLHRVAGTASGIGAVALGGDADSVLLPSAQPLKKSRKHNARLMRRFAAAGWEEPHAVALYSASQIGLPVLFGIVPPLVLGLRNGVILALVAAVIGYMAPDLWLSRKINQRKRLIQNGLPDALDLLIVCVEAGSSLDQAILRTSEELEIALPPMAHELRTLATEIRAGKPRLEAFQEFARRTNLDDVRALVTMLIQTDRFGTSIAQALRTHAETSRTRRRQRAEERAAKVGVKLVFPLVLCLLPALYVVCLGPVAVRVYRTLF
jgi:tight adherence protein C